MIMARMSMFALKPAWDAMTARRRSLLYGAALAPALLLAGCAVEVENTQAAQEVARLSRPTGSVAIGWRVFQNKCASCHGAAATGTANGPDLLPRVRDMGSRQFVSLVLKRYDWNLPPAQAGSEGAAREALIDEILERRRNFKPTMPAWDG